MPILTKANPPEPTFEYEIRDPNCREISGVKLFAGQKRIRLTARAAQFYVANGSLVPVASEAPAP
jgi:hypothetical protein